MRVAIIGTAGRKEDLSKLDPFSYLLMLSICSSFIHGIGEKVTLVSGGAAWSDHLAVLMYLDNKKGFSLELNLPAPFENGQYRETCQKFCTGKTTNYYHRQFSSNIGNNNNLKGFNSLDQLARAIETSKVNVCNGFKERNTLVANSDVLIAFTFGNKNVVKPGGTADTVRKYLSSGKTRGYHVDLNSMMFYPNIQVD